MVELRGSKTILYSPEYGSREEAEKELAKISARVGYKGSPADVSWMAASGTDILGAQVIESGAGIA
jgi:hypothetical protein